MAPSGPYPVPSRLLAPLLSDSFLKLNIYCVNVSFFVFCNFLLIINLENEMNTLTIWFYFYKQQNVGSVSKTKTLNMMKQIGLDVKKIQSCNIDEFDGHLMSSEWK